MSRRSLALALLGVAIGAWSTLCGIGGGIFAVPLLHYAYGMEMRAAVANSLVLVAASTTSATVSELFHPDTAFDVRVWAILAGASLAGTWIGYAVSRKLDARGLKKVFCGALVVVGLYVLLAPAHHATGGGVAAITVSRAFGVAAVGFVAGIVSPILGIGGGLVAVPGLFLGVQGIGYATARACSTAMSVVNSWHSLWLYRERGLFHLPTAAWFAGGALAGGVIGDQLIHVESVVAIAQRLLALTLFFAAARFAWDLRVRASASDVGKGR